MFYEKQLTTERPRQVAGRGVKTYRIAELGVTIDPDVLTAAIDHLPALFPPDDGRPAATFAVVHRSGDAVYLNAYSWVWDNVLFCRTAASGREPALGVDTATLTSFDELKQPLIGCVWELAVLEHERSAWVRWMLATDSPDLDGYLADALDRPSIGAPSDH